MSALHIQIYTAVAPRLVKCNNHSTPTHKLIFLSLSVFKCEQNSENKESGGLIGVKVSWGNEVSEGSQSSEG